MSAQILLGNTTILIREFDPSRVLELIGPSVSVVNPVSSGAGLLLIRHGLQSSVGLLGEGEKH